MTTIPRALHARIATLLRAHHVPGASVALVDAGGVRWAGGVGLADLRSGRAATEATVHHLFSGTKLFTATAVMQCVERGAFRLEDRVADLLPGAGPLGGITVRQLLSHTSGLRDSLRGLLTVRFPGEPSLSATEALALFPIRPARAPGRSVAYANVNYALLGALIEAGTGRRFASYLVQEVLAPLGVSAGLTVGGVDPLRLMTGYIDRWDPMRLALRLLHPATTARLYAERTARFVALHPYDLATEAIGGLVGTVTDFAALLVAHLRGGGPVLGPGSVHAMQSPVARGAAGIVSREAVGLGWKLGRAGTVRFLNHEGAGAGATTEVRIYPAEGIGVAIAMNAMRMPRSMRLAHAIAEEVRRSASPSSVASRVRVEHGLRVPSQAGELGALHR